MFKCSSFKLRMLACAGVALAALTGCQTAGNASRENVLAPLVARAWPDIKSDADIGIRARNNAACAQALGIQAISDELAETARVNVNEFDTAVRKYARQP